jgi:pyrimidine-nucleoside phosphorylase
MSGRGLGHTGGTLDKLESIPGFRVDLSLSEVRRQVERIGCALVGQNPELVPADGALYALRDVTATVDSTPLIASSVMAKKLAAGARAIVLDVKYGAGAFMPDLAAAEELALAMVGIGESAGRRVRALLSSMDEPLGMAVGNALEVREAIETLTGGGPAELRELSIDLGAHLMVLAGTAVSIEDATAAAGILLDSGIAADHLGKLIAAQGGDARVVEDPSLLPAAPVVLGVESEADGWVERVDARGIAAAALMVGAGRRRKAEIIDPSTGVRLLLRSGAQVSRGQSLAEVHAPTENAARAAAAAVRDAVRIAPQVGDRKYSKSIVVGK